MRKIVIQNDNQKGESPYRILSEKPIYSPALFQYLDSRKIPHDLAHRYLKQVYFLHRGSGKRIFGVGFKTRSGSYDIRNPYGFKTMIGPKDISVIKGSNPYGIIHVFEGVFDFLSWLVLNQVNHPKADILVLNSTSLYNQAANFVRAGNYDQAILWQDNDLAGQKFVDAFLDELQQHSLTISSMCQAYQGFDDLNQFLYDQDSSLQTKRDALTGLPKILQHGPNPSEPQTHNTLS